MNRGLSALHTWCLCFVALSLAACGKPSGPAPVVGTLRGADFFPLQIGNRWIYKKTSSVGMVSNSTAEYRVEASGRNFAIVDPGRGLLNAVSMQYSVPGQQVVTSRGFIGAARAEFDPPFLELPAEITHELTWAWQGRTTRSEQVIESRVEGLEKIVVPAGEFECLRIRRLVPGTAMSYVHWYSSGVGVVKAEVRKSAGDTVYELTSHELR